MDFNKIDEEDEAWRMMNDIAGSTDILLMLQSQATSIEILLGTGY